MDIVTVVFTLAFCYILAKILALINLLDESSESKFDEKIIGKSRDCGKEKEIGVGFVSDVVKIQALSDKTEDFNGSRGSSEIGDNDKTNGEVQLVAIPDGGGIKNEVARSGSVDKDSIDGVCGSPEIADQVFDEMPVRENAVEESSKGGNFDIIDAGLVKDEVESVEETEFVKEEEEQFGDDDDDDWEGIESTELERAFGVAVCFVGDKSNADEISKLSDDIKLQMYGLHKVATQGHCNQPQPMLLKKSARAKWNAWKNVGDMSPEEAMEQYIYLLSKNIPGWMQDDISDSADAIVSSKLSSDRASVVDDMSDPKA